MALLKGGNMVTGLAVAIGTTVLAPVLLPTVVRMARPAAKAAVKAGLILYDRGRETIAELGETASDVIAEARAEMQEETEVPVTEEERLTAAEAIATPPGKSEEQPA